MRGVFIAASRLLAVVALAASLAPAACMIAAEAASAQDTAQAPDALQAQDAAQAQSTSGGGEVHAVGARIAGDGERTRLVLDLSAPVRLGAFPLADPARVVVDLPEMRFDLPAGTGEEGRGLIARWRYGLIAPGKSRIVIDTTGPVAIDKSFVLAPEDGQPARLVVDLVKTSEKAFAAAVARARAERPSSHAEGGGAPVVASAALPVIVLDPGHGGIDTGAISPSGVKEKDITLPFARRLKEKLDASGRFLVMLTRDDDTFLSLGRRVEIARGHAAALFISIHADSAPQDYVRGATVYTVSDRASDAEAAAVAALENKSDIIAGVDLPETSDIVTDILVDLARRETRNFSHRFSGELVADLGKATHLTVNPQRAAGFMVLRAHDVPSVLVELGYLTNAEDTADLTNPAWREKTTDAMVDAIDAFFAPQVARKPDAAGGG
ncbi:N-acetylmuramoyl-L-alanine amidase [Pseudoxanthobacter soli DSM 19599]|uniref:N-acetylmuramoyl-L-alanine amidase n=1 Tax=Pseudoxanthobacter soli DSM 19599 TaxID=1123029 RepID=A0A1M7ZLB9_9HYPH|nr:N-acetylmuramoyl-L-alanine amidase [Pseudoxanthobacter soli]SHO65688.1 N-acetylmuramoyl-L-alanine amidase [Pseudoxanthobacter soli DSM 19599]